MNVEKLKKSLKTLSDNLKSVTNVEYADKIIFNEENIVTYNGFIFIESPLTTNVKGVVDGKLFTKFIDKIKDEEIQLKTKENDDNSLSLIVENGDSEACFQFVQDSIFIPFETKNYQWENIPEDFNRAIILCSETLAKNSIDIKTSVVHFNKNFAESSDSNKISRFIFNCQLPIFRGETEYQEFFLSKDIISVLIKNKIKSYSINDKAVAFKTVNDEIIIERKCCVEDVFYPDLGETLEQCSSGIELNFPTKLYNVVEKANIFQNDKKQEIEKELTISCKNKKIKVVSNTHGASFKEVIKTDIEQEFSFKIPSTFFLQVLEKAYASKIILEPTSFIRVESPDFVFLTQIFE